MLHVLRAQVRVAARGEAKAANRRQTGPKSNGFFHEILGALWTIL